MVVIVGLNLGKYVDTFGDNNQYLPKLLRLVLYKALYIL